MNPLVWELPISSSSAQVLIFLLTEELRNELRSVERDHPFLNCL